MKYLSRSIILVVFLLISLSSVSSINLIYSKNIRLNNFIPNPVNKSTKILQERLIHSLVDKIAKDFDS